MRLLIIIVTVLVPIITLASDYTPLVDLPGVTLDGSSQDIGRYVNAIYLLAISVAAFLAVVKIILGGVQYMMSDVVTDKGQAKKDIKGALLGLLIVLAAVLVLETINPNLTDLDVLQRADQVGVSDSEAFSLWSGAEGVDGLITSSDGTKIGTRDTFLSNDPNLDQKVTDRIVACRALGNSPTRRDFNGYTTIDCYYDSLTPPKPTSPSIDFSDGNIRSTNNYDPNATSLSIDCGAIYNTSCMNYCRSNGGSTPDRTNPAYCVISVPKVVAALHCQLDSDHSGCNYNPYGNTSAQTSGADPLAAQSDMSVPAGSTYYNTPQECQVDLPNITDAAACLGRLDDQGNRIYVPATSLGKPIYTN